MTKYAFHCIFLLCIAEFILENTLDIKYDLQLSESLVKKIFLQGDNH